MYEKLSHYSLIDYYFDGTYIYLRREKFPDTPPFAVTGPRSIPSTWTKTDFGWILRTKGLPSTVSKLQAVYGNLAQEVASTNEFMDWRILIVQSACEAMPTRRHPSGKDPLSPRTEKGYPDRKGENDPGDPARDAKDSGAHCSFGLCQTLLSTARHVKPELFKGVPKEQHRFILGEPRNSFECLAAYYCTLPESTKRDPLRVRTSFGAGGVYPSNKNVWGVRCYDRSVLDHFVAFWNDLASIL